jgi:hypothetical protein
MKNRIEIAPTIENADDLDAVLQRQKEDKVIAVGKASHILSKLVTQSTEHRLSCQLAEYGIKFVDELVRPCLAVVSDVIPDFDKVGVDVRAFDNGRHLILAIPISAALTRISLDLVGVPCGRLATVKAILNGLAQMV